TPACSQAAGSRSRSPRITSVIVWSVSAAGTSRVSLLRARSKKSRPMTRGGAESISASPRPARPRESGDPVLWPRTGCPLSRARAEQILSSQPLQPIRARHPVKLAARRDAEHALAVDVALLAELDQIVEQRARHQRPQIAAHMEIRLEPAGLFLRL